ncbi:phage virion morphogenesis protein [Achromobacter sp. 2789STDY5608621]|uniref:phage virion morphogenesis protein n=1 Tax=Achromobacter sp. 2789STDY5608621 TaxID=1806496 RepID=UPI0006C44905|nr:phage virion morphogenesis protein [Achromobacter sp. 2789STDY5608621]CUJ55617.1 Mu-like prophage protein gpG [Achromobacter sp. 2789STDY5608621]
MLVVTVNDAQFAQTMKRLAELAQDMTPALRGIGEYLAGSSRDRFGSQTAPDGSAWTPLAHWYREAKPANKDKILTLRGYLSSSIHWQVLPDSVLVGSNLEYAAIHQFGGVIRPKQRKALKVGGRAVSQVKIPARPYLGISTDDATESEALVADYLAGAFKGGQG